MITRMFPKDFQRYLNLPVLGPMMDSYAVRLFDQQYTRRSSQYELRMAARVCELLRDRGIQCVSDVSEGDMEACYQLFRQKFPKEEGSVRVLSRFLMEQAVVQPSPAPAPSQKHPPDYIHSSSADLIPALTGMTGGFSGNRIARNRVLTNKNIFDLTGKQFCRVNRLF